jgi:hypothetical protein
MSDGKRPGAFDRADEFLTLFRRGAEFTKDLLAENERLRTALVGIEDQQQDAAQDPTEWGKLRQQLLARIQGLEAERGDFMEQLQAVEEENRHFADRYLEVEEENNVLANLYVASYQLHSTLELPEVLKTVTEIVINLIGAEVFALYILDEKTAELEAVAVEGADQVEFPRVRLGSGVVGGVVLSGETACDNVGPSATDDCPIVCIPLRVGERPIGAIAIMRLLSQKQGFSALDHELFTLLAGHAATAIFAAQLHGHSERKLTTIQGFIDLLTK